jgi:hypothetical protein
MSNDRLAELIACIADDELGDAMKRLDNKVAIVTGASKGIGAGIAKAFGAEARRWL